MPRLLRPNERELLSMLLSRVDRTLDDRNPVRDLQDGGMGSIQFIYDNQEKMGRVLVEGEAQDSDGTPLLISVNTDQLDRIFELDIWKVNYAPLQQYQRPEQATHSTKRRLPLMPATTALISTPTLLTTEPVLTARIPLHIPRDGMMTQLPPALEELYRAINTQHLTPAGPWFAHHTELPSTHFRFDACVPLTQPITATGRVEPGILPAMHIARTLYRGPYTHLPQAWAEFRAWLTAHSLSTAPEVIERYTVNPNDTLDPTQLQTELVWPLAQEAIN